MTACGLLQNIMFTCMHCCSYISQVIVVPEGAESVSRPSPDYPMLPTIPLSAFSDPKKSKPSHGSKVSKIFGA